MPENRNLLAKNTFEMVFSRLKDTVYFLQNSGIPGIGFDGAADVSTMRKNLPTPGDQLTYGPLILEFMISEDLSSWLGVYEWLLGIGTPKSGQQRPEYERVFSVEPPSAKHMTLYGDVLTAPKIESDATLVCLSSDNIPVIKVKYKDVWPLDLSGIFFDSTTEGVSYMKARAIFHYSIYEIVAINT